LISHKIQGSHSHSHFAKHFTKWLQLHQKSHYFATATAAAVLGTAEALPKGPLVPLGLEVYFSRPTNDYSKPVRPHITAACAGATTTTSRPIAMIRASWLRTTDCLVDSARWRWRFWQTSSGWGLGVNRCGRLGWDLGDMLHRGG
jgi:hypothetical protein